MLDRDRVAAKNVTLPPARGALFATLYADRDRVNRKGSVTFMMDLAYEKKPDASTALLLNERADGDLIKAEGDFKLILQVIPKDGAA